MAEKSTLPSTSSIYDGPQEARPPVSLSENNMDTPEHQSLYARGLEMRKKVVGEDYVANALEKGKGDFLRPLQQFATVCDILFISPKFCTIIGFLFQRS